MLETIDLLLYSTVIRQQTVSAPAPRTNRPDSAVVKNTHLLSLKYFGTYCAVSNGALLYNRSVNVFASESRQCSVEMEIKNVCFL